MFSAQAVDQSSMFYVLCGSSRFCEKEFHGPLSVQEDWVRHLQEHILNLKKEGAATSPPSPLPQPTSPILLTLQPV